MRARAARTALTPLLCLLVAAAGTSQSITTTFVSNNGGAAGWANMFDINVLNPEGLRITAFDVNSNSAANTPFTLDVYITPSTYVGKEDNAQAWIKVSSGPGVTSGRDTPTPVDVSDFFLAPGSYGIALYFMGAGPAYTNGTGGNQSYSNADIALQLGIAKVGFFSGLTFNPRVWNGTIHYATRGHAAYGVFGEGCRGSAGVPTLAAAAGSLPRIGSTFTVELGGMPPQGGAALMLLGFSKTTFAGLGLPLDLSALGMPGCSLHVSITLTFGVSNTAGSGSWPVPIPNDPSLLGGPFYNQGLVLEPAANPFGAILTNAGEGVVGR